MTALSGFAFIDDAYERLLREPWFTERPGQRELSRDIFTALSTKGSSYVAEAPTGTGKTLGYLIGGFAAARLTRIPIVVATATVVLQRQVVDQDLRSLTKVGIIPPREIALLKGRGRYYCPFLAESVGKVTPQASLFQTDEEKYRGQDLVRAMHVEYLATRWDGDLDAWGGPVPEMWPEVSCSSQSCLGSACSFASKCVFMRSRASAAFASIIVTNHDMVLTDLQARGDGGQVIPLDNYALVVDEGHHLPDKAVARATVDLDFDVGNWLDHLAEWRDMVKPIPGAAEAAMKNDAGADLDDCLNEVRLRSLLMSAQVELAQYLPPSRTDRRFPNGLPVTYGAMLSSIGLRAQIAKQATASVNKFFSSSLKEAVDQRAPPVKLKHMRGILARGVGVEDRLRRLSDAVTTLWVGTNPVVWAYEGPHGLGLKSSPLEGADVLNEILWPSGTPVAIVSATLQALGKFDRFAARSGLPLDAVRKVFAPVLPYHRSDLILCDPGKSPKDDDFEKAVVVALDEIIDKGEGTLVLFTANSLLKSVQKKLSPELGGICLAQFTRPNSVLVSTHKARVDAGKGSVLLGVDSFAEGLDLPGKYCTHVVIVRLPFARPDNPVEQARQEADPEGYFRNSSLPDAGIKLIQCAGRLVRRESDTGRVSVLDNRLLYKKYGAEMLASLPPFTRKRKLVGMAQVNTDSAKEAT